jgi:trehalose/maltose hydrolase-like predicted phosphorylase
MDSLPDSGDSFCLETSVADPAQYFATYLANGYFSTTSSLLGTAPALSLMVGLMDHTAGDVSRPAAIPAWSEIDYSPDGNRWLNAAPVSPVTLRDYQQVLQMREGLMATRYTWGDPGRVTRCAVTTWVSQSDPHLATNRFELTPEFSGAVRLRFPLQAWPAPAQRFALGKLSWQELKDTMARGASTRAVPVPPGGRPAAPSEILTWFDLQEALAAEGRELVLPGPTASTRAAIWYPGEVALEKADADATDYWLSFSGRAVGSARVSLAAAIELPVGLQVASTKILREARGTTLEVAANVETGRTYAFTKYVSISREGWAEGIGDDLARVRAARTEGYAALTSRHQAAWHRLWISDIVVEGDLALQRAIHSDLFYLLQNSTVDTGWAMTACAFTPHYYGHVFWDSDNWAFPVLLMLHPERAKSLVMFRHRTLEWAKANAARRGYRGAMYPWESDPDLGTEQTPRFAGVNSEREIHLNGNIASAQWQYYLATGDREWLRQYGFPVISATADFWLSRVSFNAKDDRYEILGVTSVDEKYTDVNNETFTNGIAQKNLRIATAAAELLGVKPDPQWTIVADKMYLPFSESEQRHLVFDPTVAHDRKTWMAGSLTFLTYPSLDLPMSDAVRRNDYAYALRKNAELSPELNQMMVVMLAIHAAELGEGADALRWLQHERDRFQKPPYNLRSETPLNNTTGILATGSGFLQNFLLGFTGLRVTEVGLAQSYPPVLPPGLQRLRLPRIIFQGSAIEVIVDRDASGRTRLLRRPSTLSSS